MLDNNAQKRAYTVYCSPNEVKIIENIKKDFREKEQIKVSNSEVLKKAIRKLGEDYI